VTTRSRAARDACKDVLSRISAYLDGDLPAPQCHDIERHCRDCPACTELTRGLRETIGLCQEAGRTPLPDAVRRRARASVQALLAPTAPQTKRRREQARPPRRS
jgi:anti-sigma factor RsiW